MPSASWSPGSSCRSSSWALVMSHHHDPENRSAGYIYIVMASFGTLALLLAFGLLAGGAAAMPLPMRRRHSGLAGPCLSSLSSSEPAPRPASFRLHVWLPLAHPAAPSHVSALMSGVMTKVAVYGFVRIVFDLVGQPAWWWSIVVIVLGGITCVLGVLSALMQRDLKRLLAYTRSRISASSSSAWGWRSPSRPTACWRPRRWRSPPRCSTSSTIRCSRACCSSAPAPCSIATGERDMEKLGGLIHRMPRTAFLFLTGCIAISALPPLNGFVSEWLTFQAILLSPALPSWGLKIIVPAVGAMLALSAALAAACFVRAFGVSFLGRPRSPLRRKAQEVDRVSLAAMLAFAGLCLLAGVLPGLCHRCSRPRGAEPRRRPHARAGGAALAVDRADRREPQLL